MKNTMSGKVVNLTSYSDKSRIFRPNNELTEADFQSAPPSYVMDKIAMREWNAIAPAFIRRGLLDEEMKPLLAGYCLALARAIRAEEIIEQEGRYYKTISGTGSIMRRRHPAAVDAEEGWSSVRKFATQLGITARCKLSVATTGRRHLIFK